MGEDQIMEEAVAWVEEELKIPVNHPEYESYLDAAIEHVTEGFECND